MAEGPDAFVFVSELDYAQTTLGLDDIATGIEDVATITEDASARMDAALSQVDASLGADAGGVDNLDGAVGGLEGALSTIIEYLDILAETTINTLDTTTSLASALEDLAAASADVDTAVAEESSFLSDLIATLTGAADAALRFGADMEEGVAAMGDFGGNIGEILAIMAGFAIFNDAGKLINFWGDSMIGGNAELQQFNMQLTALTGSSSAAQKLLAWSYQFGLQVPDTTQNLQKAIVTIESLGLNAQQVVPDLASVAATMGVKLPTAAQAFMDAYEGRFFMMQRQLRISKEELEKYGLQIGKNGKIVQDTLAPAFERFVAAHYPNALAAAMQTWNGAMANATDLVQQLGMHFGAPVFNDFLDLLLQIEQSVAAHKQEWFDVATAIGTNLGGAVEKVIQLFTVFGRYLITHRTLLIGLASAIGGVLVGALAVMISGISGFLLSIAPFVVIFGALGAGVTFIAQAFMRAYNASGPLRQEVMVLREALDRLMAALGPLIHGALVALQGAFKNASDALTRFFSSPQVLQFIQDLSQHILQLAIDLSHPKQFLLDLEQHLGKLGGFLLGLLPMVLGVGGGFGLFASGGVKPVLGVIGDLVGWLGKIAPFLSGIGGELSPLTGIFLQGSLVMGAFKTVVKAVWDELGNLPISILMTHLKSLFGIFTAGGKFTALDVVRDSLKNLVEYAPRIGGFFSTLEGGLSGLLSGALPTLSGIFSSLGATIASTWTTAIVPLLPFIAVIAAVVIAVYSVVDAFIHFWQTSAQFRAAVMGMLSQIMGLGSYLMATLRPVMAQLHQTLQTQLLPAWQQLQMVFHELQPLFIVIGAIILGILAVALGILIGVIKGLIAALGPLLTGVIEVFGGIVTVIMGVINLIVDEFMDWWKFLDDLFHGRWDRLWTDVVMMFSHFGQNVMQIFSGLWTMVVGVTTGFFGTIFAMLGGFWSGVVGWFTSLADKLVGHSVWPDMLMSMIDHLGQFVINVENRIAAWVMAIIAHFAALALQALAEFSHMETMLFSVVDNMINRIPGQVQTLVDDIVSVIGQLPGIMLQAGQHMVQNFIHGMQNMMGGAASAAQNLAGTIARYLHFTVPDEGPLHDADQWMPHFGDVISQGMRAQAPKLGDAASSLGQTQRDTYLGGLGVDGAGAGPTTASAAAAFPTTAGDAGARGALGSNDRPIVVEFRSNNSMALQTLLGLLSPSDRQAFADMIGQQLGRNANLQYITDRGYAG